MPTEHGGLTQQSLLAVFSQQQALLTQQECVCVCVCVFVCVQIKMELMAKTSIYQSPDCKWLIVSLSGKHHLLCVFVYPLGVLPPVSGLFSQCLS